MNLQYNKLITSFVIASLAIVLALSTGGSHVKAQESEEPAARFSLKSVSTTGSYFTLTMSPGETQKIQVEVGNSGTAAGDAYVYLADVSTRVNGGMGIGLAGAPLSDPALWIDFTEDTVHLDAGATVIKTFTVSVPEDVAPGQFLTSAVVQDAGDGVESAGSGLMLTAVSRQALGILITVPGPITPVLEMTAANHEIAGGGSVVTVQAANSGNVLLKTTGEFTLTDSDDRELFQSDVQYLAIYAGTDTTLETPIDFMLAPGDYFVYMSLEDEKRDFQVESGPLPLHVPEPPEGSPANPATEDEDLTVIETQIVGIPTWVLLIAIPLAILAGAVLAFLALKRRMQQSMLAAGVAQPQVAVQQSTTPYSKPVNVRKMTPPARGTNSNHETNEE